MDDWEQPSTSAQTFSAGGDIEILRQELARAVERIDTLERRVAELEAQASGTRTKTFGA
jgi:hypothetical protein